MKLAWICALFFSINSLAQDVDVVDFPAGILPSTINQVVDNNDLMTLENISASLSGMPKINHIDSPSNAAWPYVGFSSTSNWPSGAWGQGYFTELILDSGDGQYEFYSLIVGNTNKYHAGHPLIRRASEFIVGHLNVYNSGYTFGNSLQKTKDGIDFLLLEQIAGGGNQGAFHWYITRTSQTDLLIILRYQRT